MGGDEGPNDARCVVWAIGTYFLLSILIDTNLFFNVYIGSIYVLYGPGWLRWAAMKAQMTPDVSFGP